MKDMIPIVKYRRPIELATTCSPNNSANTTENNITIPPANEDKKITTIMHNYLLLT